MSCCCVVGSQGGSCGVLAGTLFIWSSYSPTSGPHYGRETWFVVNVVALGKGRSRIEA